MVVFRSNRAYDHLAKGHRLDGDHPVYTQVIDLVNHNITGLHLANRVRMFCICYELECEVKTLTEPGNSFQYPLCALL